MKKVKVFAPATIANLGSGYDVLGIAIEKPGDIIVAKKTKAHGLFFSVKTEHSNVPGDAKNNLAAYVATLMMEEFAPAFGIEMMLYKRMPVGSGLGSSAASSVASVVAVNALLPKPLKKIDLLRFAIDGERKATGAPHADNAAPSLLGGVCLIRSYTPLDILQLPIKNSAVWIVVHPHIIVETKLAREILPKEIPLHSAIRQWGNVGGITYGLIRGDAALIGKCTEDIIIEPVRKKLIPAFDNVKNAALQNGASGCSLSGSGPSLFAVTDSVAKAKKIATAMKKTFLSLANIQSESYISCINCEGAKIISAQ
jgi:homoserine kinase